MKSNMRVWLFALALIGVVALGSGCATEGYGSYGSYGYGYSYGPMYYPPVYYCPPSPYWYW